MPREIFLDFSTVMFTVQFFLIFQQRCVDLAIFSVSVSFVPITVVL